MACKPDEVFDVIDNQQAVDKAIALLKEETLLAVKCISSDGTEGNRKTDIIFVMIATKEKAYIFDIPNIGKTVITSSLKGILESKSQEKLMFDCREQSDALWHQFQVKLSGVLDLQLLEVMYRRQKSSSKKPVAKHTRRSHRPEEVEFVYGLYRCMELYVGDILFQGKDEHERRSLIKLCRVRLFQFNATVLPELRDAHIKEIFLTKVTSLFALYEKMKEILSAEEKNRLLIASERYADFYRNREKRSFDNYEVGKYDDVNISKMPDLNLLMSDARNLDGFMDAYLPLDIIPDKGMHSFFQATHVCTTCARKFPREEFSNTQLQNGKRKCRVCKEIKRRGDVELNREENYERNRFRWRSWRYRDDSDDDYDDDYDDRDYFPPCGNDHCYHWGCSCGEGYDEYDIY